MKLAIEEHLECTQYPRVGAVIAKNGDLLSTGHRGEEGKLHAERVAIKKLNAEQLSGSSIYTTLEPCVGVYDEQVPSCADLIVNSGISEAIIGVLDPNGSIYSQGYRKLLENNISVSFFNRKLRAAVEEETFEYGQIDKLIGSGKRRVPVVNSGINITLQFSESDSRTLNFRWATLQPGSGCVDLISGNGSVKAASGTTSFSDIIDPTVFRFASHFSRMRINDVAVVQPPGLTFFVLIKLIEIYEKEILFQWEVRNDL